VAITAKGYTIISGQLRKPNKRHSEFLWQVTAVKFREHFSDQNAKKYLSMNIFFGLSPEKKSILQKGFQKEEISRSGT
jgi:hypothetical protein